MATSKKQWVQHPTWEYENLNELLIATAGNQYGPNPAERLDEIREDRGRWAQWIRGSLDLQPHHVVADLGSGCGFVAGKMAPHVKHIYCLDISSSFLDYCRHELREFDNATFCQVDYGRFAEIKDASLDGGYATAVFVHFNYYDFTHYLRELARVLKPRAGFHFDFLNADSLDIEGHETFSKHCRGYPGSRKESVFNVVHPFSGRALENLLPQVGFHLATLNFRPGNANTTAKIIRLG